MASTSTEIQEAIVSCLSKAPGTLEECLQLISREAGAGFCTGVLLGSAFHSLKGLCASPNGARLAWACQAVRLNVPRVTSKFASWTALYTAFDCALQAARRTDDPWNRFASGAAATGLLSLRRGPGTSARFAVLGGALTSHPEVLDILVIKKDDRGAQRKSLAGKIREIMSMLQQGSVSGEN